MILRRVLMMPCKILFREHLKNTIIIALIGSDIDKVGGLGDAL